MKANSLCHRGVRATNGHLITPPRSGNELAPVQSIASADPSQTSIIRQRFLEVRFVPTD
jgi:hypothetical protein